VAVVWRRLCNDEHHNLYVLPNIIRVVKSWHMGFAWCVARTRDGKCIQNFGRNT
jgi:hypothetical protein